ncbi:DUF4265 domain-containing protein [Micromonospora echinospora]|uniref:DUF4265 domain-containing protein n=1 Tax=Micromonospora echinospora TaxID=1877 RepID=UPI003A86B981
MAGAVYINHLDPLGKNAPYQIAMVDLTYAGLPGQVEQLCLNSLDDRRFRIACIPFCAYGLAYLDEVVLDPEGVFVQNLVAFSGNRVLRALVHEGGGDSADEVCGSIKSVAADLGLGVEMHGERFLAFDIPRDVDVRQLVDVMASWASRGALNFEWSDVRSFVYSRG